MLALLAMAAVTVPVAGSHIGGNTWASCSYSYPSGWSAGGSADAHAGPPNLVVDVGATYYAHVRVPAKPDKAQTGAYPFSSASVGESEPGYPVPPGYTQIVSADASRTPGLSINGPPEFWGDTSRANCAPSTSFLDVVHSGIHCPTTPDFFMNGAAVLYHSAEGDSSGNRFFVERQISPGTYWAFSDSVTLGGQSSDYRAVGALPADSAAIRELHIVISPDLCSLKMAAVPPAASFSLL
jgi:hypothetical protein